MATTFTPARDREVLYEHPAVHEAAVVGVPDDPLGEEVGRDRLAPGAEADPAAIRDFVKDRVAGYKDPRRIWFVDELPKGPTGRILRRGTIVLVQAGWPPSTGLLSAPASAPGPALAEHGQRVARRHRVADHDFAERHNSPGRHY